MATEVVLTIWSSSNLTKGSAADAANEAARHISNATGGNAAAVADVSVREVEPTDVREVVSRDAHVNIKVSGEDRVAFANEHVTRNSKPLAISSTEAAQAPKAPKAPPFKKATVAEVNKNVAAEKAKLDRDPDTTVAHHSDDDETVTPGDLATGNPDRDAEFIKDGKLTSLPKKEKAPSKSETKTSSTPTSKKTSSVKVATPPKTSPYTRTISSPKKTS